jgi:hypothetical protein
METDEVMSCRITLFFGANMHSAPRYYEIRIKGRFSKHSAVWFEDMTLSTSNKTSPVETIISGYIVDQAALYGTISRIRNLGLELISVKSLGKNGNRSSTKLLDIGKILERR